MAEETSTAIRTDTERKDRVLIVEDEDNARKGYEQLLQNEATTSSALAAPRNALRKIQGGPA